jgi:hypothetical protein
MRQYLVIFCTSSDHFMRYRLSSQGAAGLIPGVSRRATAFGTPLAFAKRNAFASSFFPH